MATASITRLRVLLLMLPVVRPALTSGSSEWLGPHSRQLANEHFSAVTSHIGKEKASLDVAWGSYYNPGEAQATPDRPLGDSIDPTGPAEKVTNENVDNLLLKYLQEHFDEKSKDPQKKKEKFKQDFLNGWSKMMNDVPGAYDSLNGIINGRDVAGNIFSLMTMAAEFLPPMAGTVLMTIGALGSFFNGLFGGASHPQEPPKLTQLTVSDFRSVLREELSSAMRNNEGSSLVTEMMALQNNIRIYGERVARILSPAVR